MNFTPWHLKYRPQNLSEIVGQPLISRTLTNLIETQKIPNAFLFSGSRGTGKTSTARILAKSLNCNLADKPTLTPCGECSSCRGISQSNSLEVVELDGASNNGVDDIRSLIEQSSLASLNGRYRVFIIDEVHQITRQGQNAFLKTLEEPNPTVVFILATTEPEKLLDTIISRTLHLRFTQLSVNEIKSRLSDLAAIETINISQEAIEAIARCSKGGMRDSIQLLYQLATGSSEITISNVYEAVGDIPPSQLEAIANAILTGQVHQLLTLSSQLSEGGIEAFKAFESILSLWKDLLAIALCQEIELFQSGESPLSSSLPLEVLWNLSGQISPQCLIEGFKRLEEAQKRIAYSNTPHLWLQTTLLSLTL